MSADANYELVRGEVLRMLDATEADVAGDLQFLLDAPPSIVERLRHHSSHVGGARPEECRPHDDEARRRLEGELRKLRGLEGDALLVPEAPALGGFGYEIEGALYNADTLKFFATLIALERGAVLEEIRTPGRRLVCEIGAGWGGFAYQFKTLFPDVTYVVVDLPERFLLSATYLMTLFPEAKVRFHGGDEPLADWEDIDFAFVPARASSSLHGRQPDLMLDMPPFEDMTAEAAAGRARLAWELGCPFLYSYTRDGGVREALGRYYWMYEVPVLELEPPPLPERLLPPVAPDPSGSSRHAVGWRRAAT